MRIRHFISIPDTPTEDILEILNEAARQKAALAEGPLPPILAQKTLGMIFEKPSLRTRASFETAMTQLGGHAMFLGPQEIAMGKREAVCDVARVLSRYVDIICARVFLQKHVVELAQSSRVPVINAMSNDLHPCQALADIMTVRERLGAWEGKKICFVGDGNNVARSLGYIAAKLGVASYAIASPKGFEMDADSLKTMRQCAGGRKMTITAGNDPRKLCVGVDVIYTDVWASMHQKDEEEQRKAIFQGFQVNDALVALAAADAIVLHCLPANRGQEITDSVMDGPCSAVYDQAENRLHTQRALLTLLLAS
jgi:ornithine carbamoyltransferase